jgi:hypothetical protein
MIANCLEQQVHEPESDRTHGRQGPVLHPFVRSVRARVDP